jgi:RNA polymerase sigma factor (sigma-70 family)
LLGFQADWHTLDPLKTRDLLYFESAKGVFGSGMAFAAKPGDDDGFKNYAIVRIRGQIWDEIRQESGIPRRLLNSESKPEFEPLPLGIIKDQPEVDEVAHFRAILSKINSLPLREREHQVIETYAYGGRLEDLADTWGTSASRVTQTRTRLLEKMKILIQEADL